MSFATDGGYNSENFPKPAVQGLRRFYDLVAAEPKVSITALQTVGIHGHDGFAIAVVTADP